MKIAIVGSGISGLTCASLLAARHEVHLFESANYLGGHTNTIAVKTASGEYNVDTGFIVFNKKNYPGFVKLMDRFGVESRESSMSFSVKSEATGLEYNGADLKHLFIQKKNILNYKFVRMVGEILKFNSQAVSGLSNLTSEVTLGQYLEQNKYSEYFCELYALAMGGAIWSASADQMRNFPFKYFVAFLNNHGMLTIDDRPVWRTIKGGSGTYISKLTKGIEGRIYLNSPVKKVERLAAGVEVEGFDGRSRTFDHVILAVHSDQALKMVKDLNGSEVDILSAIKYQANETLLHTDETVLPKNKQAWASWNYLIPKKRIDRVSVSYNMNILQGISSPETFLVSLNLQDQIDPAKIIRKINYHHPVYDGRTFAAQKRWSEVSGVDRIHYCGAYWGYGFHEDGVQSALRVCGAFGVGL